MSARKRGKRCRGGPAACGHALESDCVPEGKKKKKKKKKGRKKKEASGRTAASETETEKRAVGRKGEENGTGGRPNEPFLPTRPAPLDFNSCYYWNTWPPRATGRLLFPSYRFSPQRQGRVLHAKIGTRTHGWNVTCRSRYTYTWDPLDALPRG